MHAPGGANDPRCRGAPPDPAGPVLPSGVTPTLGLSRYEGGYDLKQFKDDIESALRAQFGSPAVERGNKALHVRETTRGLKADVVPCETLISHSSRSSSVRGIQIEPDHGLSIHNF